MKVNLIKVPLNPMKLLLNSQNSPLVSGFRVRSPRGCKETAVLPYPHLFHMLQECLEQICIVTKHGDFTQKKWSLKLWGWVNSHIFTIFLLGESSINPSYLRVPSGSCLVPIA